MKKIIIFVGIFLCLLFSVKAEQKKDTIRTYRLGELVITGYEKISQINSATNSLSYRLLQESDVRSFSDLSLYLPSADIRTNSRGESLVFIRGAGERQLGLFLDGALITIPWDNVLDLNQVPTDIIGKISIDKNSNSILMGANILGGSINISTLERGSDGFGGSFKAQFTDGGGYLTSIMQDGKIGDFNYITNFSYNKTDGAILSGNAPEDMMHQSKTSHLRTNTDMERFNFYIRGEYKPAESTTIGLSANITSTERGIASQSTEYASAARFWRYSDWNRNFITFNGEQKFRNNLTFRTTLWADNFSQQIDSYDSTFSALKQIQNDKDFTFGNRFALEYQLSDRQYISAVYNSYFSDHDETIDSKPTENDALRTDNFTQYTYSGGLEYKGYFDSFSVFGGVTYDGNVTPHTGVFTDNEGLSYSDYGLFVGGRYIINEHLSVYTNVSRRTRFPSLREAYSGALGKFTVNPDLTAETGIMTDLGLSWQYGDIIVNIAGFRNSYDNMIVKVKDPNDSKKQIRMNIAEALIYGFDAEFVLFKDSPYIIQGNFAYMKSSGQMEGVDQDKLEYKPNIISSLILGYKFDFGFKPQFELEHTGEQFANIDSKTGAADKIDPSTLMNFRIGYGFFAWNNYFELFGRVNNIADEYVLSQIGFPEPGRTFSAGMQMKF